MDTNFIIKHLDLKPLPDEGGYYKETYKSGETLSHHFLPERYTSDKSFGTAIYYLITADTYSAMHRLPSDELFHFYSGDPVKMLRLFPDGTGDTIVLGNDLEKGQLPQCSVPRDTWQGMNLIDVGRFALMGITVAPSFDFSDLEMGDRNKLIKHYPDFKDTIEILTYNHKAL